MIGPPGLPKLGRRVFSFAGAPPARASRRPHIWKLAGGLYMAGVLAHFSHAMAFDLPAGIDPSLSGALGIAPLSLVWPADLIGTLMALT
ncbi:MAG TPA: hypothetical protein VGQ90_01760 [Stellaceae bacterium]|jgi:hypothetical protein|nr:hypothetical protein [Stellaceae bacterium]